MTIASKLYQRARDTMFIIRLSGRMKLSRTRLLLLFMLTCLWLTPPLLNASSEFSRPITTQTLGEVGFFPVHSAPASTVSLNDTRVSAEINGVIQEITVRAGEEVDAGTVLARLDCEEHTLALQQARALSQAARANAEFSDFQLQRAQQLARSQALSAEVLNERDAQAKRNRAEVSRLQAAERTAQRRVNRCEIRAPFTAVVIERVGSVGELAQAGTVIARILDLQELEVSGNIQQQDLPTLVSSGAIRFVADGEVYPVDIRAELPMVDERLRSVTVRFRFTEHRARPGQVGRIEWVSHQIHAPADLLVRRNDRLGVFSVADGEARFIPLEGIREGQPPPLNLPIDTPLIIDGRFALRDGDSVRIVPR
ncbi:efflux RND transporter periplasmic adaptor subunit [Ectothiorhodospira lacustris]|uniref:efflux RND transporter periplasmic adaptor subunit n=1 Tax=Ectothiorhodospira lacustris TaxID=2899127 RepID=UPI001EE9018E|nr:efflux RND transporter periplasmic adaptor subunit [Ectothiorhodospira lacustris]MCG5510854.1 efflux RND transporter periplasmic adaptor subunit [Ectothiorhodospira lacustris]MCG5522600.1 efflux RND transporter periplasmic adaptor subunit [Ectothiorhodospira lacustris]